MVSLKEITAFSMTSASGPHSNLRTQCTWGSLNPLKSDNSWNWSNASAG